MPTSIADDLCRFLDSCFPPELAEDWDNTGWLLGDRQQPLRRVMTCLTLTPESCAEAIREQADVVVVHHPLPFRPLQSITTDTPAGRMLWSLARAGIGIYSPHTAFDSAVDGINQQIAVQLGLSEIRPLEPAGHSPAVSPPVSSSGQTGSQVPIAGTGRQGRLPQPIRLDELARQLKSVFPTARVRAAAAVDARCQRVAIACGSGGSLLPLAVRAGCDTLVTGEASFHQCLEARAEGIALFLVGHYQSERFALEELARRLARQFPDCPVWASRDEADPLQGFD